MNILRMRAFHIVQKKGDFIYMKIKCTCENNENRKNFIFDLGQYKDFFSIIGAFLYLLFKIRSEK